MLLHLRGETVYAIWITTWSMDKIEFFREEKRGRKNKP
jgi:hypothetical protein